MLSVENHRVEKFPQTDQSVCGNFVYMEIYQPPKPAYDGHDERHIFTRSRHAYLFFFNKKEKIFLKFPVFCCQKQNCVL